jgi:hypothetical protein
MNPRDRYPISGYPKSDYPLSHNPKSDYPISGYAGSDYPKSGYPISGYGGSAATDERPWRYAPVTCAQCSVVVQVAKFSLQHTSIQWSAGAVRGCTEFSSAEENSALIPTCASLRDSIEDAVAGGRVEVLPP